MDKKTLIVSDTGPIITFCVLHKLHVLHELFENVVIPEGVYNELNHEKYKDDVRMIIDSPFITVEKVRNEGEVQRLLNASLELHRGESEAIVLAEELASISGGKYLIVDDLKARTYADMRGISTIGAIGVLMMAIREHLISPAEVEICIDAMKIAHRFYSDALYDELRRVALETSFENTPKQAAQKSEQNEILLSNLVKSFQKQKNNSRGGFSR